MLLHLSCCSRGNGPVVASAFSWLVGVTVDVSVRVTREPAARSERRRLTLSGPHSRSWQWSQRAGAAAAAGAQRCAGAGGGGAAARRPRTSTSSVPRLCHASVARRTTPDDIDELRCTHTHTHTHLLYEPPTCDNQSIFNLMFTTIRFTVIYFY